MSDARFEDAGPAPLRLRAFDADDLGVISALVQDSVFPASEMQFDRRKRRFAVLLNRFRWEDRQVAAPERVQSVLIVEDVENVQTSGLDERSSDTVMSLLSMEFVAGAEGAGRLLLTFAGDGELAVDVEALEVTLTDVTRPYSAPAGQRPSHPE